MGNEIEEEVEVEDEDAAVAGSKDLQRWLSQFSSSTSSASSSSSSSAVPIPLLPKMPDLSLNHVSFVCKSVAESVRFYEDVLGFVVIERPSSFNFEEAWLFNYGIGIHLLESENFNNKKGAISPKDNHISFQCSNLKLLEQRVLGMGIDYISAAVTEGGIQVEQIFFHDPDGYMVEICDCENLSISPCPLKLPNPRGSDMQCTTQVSAKIMENFLIDFFDISM